MTFTFPTAFEYIAAISVSRKQSNDQTDFEAAMVSFSTLPVHVAVSFVSQAMEIRMRKNHNTTCAVGYNPKHLGFFVLEIPASPFMQVASIRSVRIMGLSPPLAPLRLGVLTAYRSQIARKACPRNESCHWVAHI